MNAMLDQLRKDTAALAMECGRRVGMPGHDVARDFLVGRLGEMGLEPFEGGSFVLPYTGTRYSEYIGSERFEGHVFENIVGVVPGRDRSLPPLLLGAHYDSVIDGPCADDNATSVALNLAVAEALMLEPLERDVIIALYDAEEPPYFQGEDMGSTRFYEEHCKGRKFAGVVVSDLIGHDLDVLPVLEGLGGSSRWVKMAARRAGEVMFLLGAETDAVFPKMVERLAKGRKGLRVFPTLNEYIGNMSDHHAFEKAGVPFLFLSCGQGRYYHHPQDNLEWINFEKLGKITLFVEDVLRALDAEPVAGGGRVDPWEFECRMIRRLVGGPGILLLRLLGVKLPKSREEISKMVKALVQGMG